MENPLITVIVPVYKVENYLERCVNSVINQTYKNLEIILVDDGSPDRCGEICEELAKTDSRIKVIHKENGGLSSARNAGLDIMSGEYVGFVDSDDFIDEKMYSELLCLALKYDAKIACCGIEEVADNGHLNYFNNDHTDFFCYDTQQAMAELTFNRKITNSLCDKLFHKSIFSELRMTEGIIYEDHDVMHKCIYNAEKVVYTGAPYYKYFINEASITGGKFSKKFFDFLPIGRKRLEFYATYSDVNLNYAKIQYIEWALYLIYKSEKNKVCTECKDSLIKEIKEMLNDNPQLPFSKNTKLKVLFFKLHPKFFVLFLSFYYFLNKD